MSAGSTLIPDENGVGLEAAILNFGAWMQPSGKPQLSIAASCELTEKVAAIFPTAMIHTMALVIMVLVIIQTH